MRRILREPFVHFLLAGGALLAFVSFFRGDTRLGSPSESTRNIRVDAQSLRQFVQAKTGIEDPRAFAASFAELDASMIEAWIERFVREEALVREARRLGLDQQDDLIRRRLVQQIEFVALGVVETNLEFGEEQLQEIYLERAEDYRVPAALSFSHVFVRVEDGREVADQRAHASTLLDALNRERLDASAASGRGDRFLYNRHYVDRTLEEVESHFGVEMGRALATLSVNASQWQGPFRSSHGFHLVLLTRSEASRLPPADEIRDLLYQDWRRELRDEALDTAVEKILSEYQIELDPELSSRRDR